MTEAASLPSETANQTSLESRKLRLIGHILDISDEEVLSEIEYFIFDDSPEDETTEEELSFIAERIQHAKSHSDESIPFEDFMKKMRQNLL